jgi:hypothetical protein
VTEIAAAEAPVEPVPLPRRRQRRRDGEAAAAKQAENDAKSRSELRAARNRSYAPALLIADLAPVKKALESVPIDQPYLV